MLQCSDSTLYFDLTLVICQATHLCFDSVTSLVLLFASDFFFFWGRTPCVLSVPTHTHMHIHTCVHTENIGEALLHILLREGMAKWWFLTTASTCKVNKRSNKFPAYLRSQCIDESCDSYFHLTAHHHICKVTAILNSIFYFVITKSFCKIFIQHHTNFHSASKTGGYRLSFVHYSGESNHIMFVCANNIIK